MFSFNFRAGLICFISPVYNGKGVGNVGASGTEAPPDFLAIIIINTNPCFHCVLAILLLLFKKCGHTKSGCGPSISRVIVSLA